MKGAGFPDRPAEPCPGGREALRMTCARCEAVSREGARFCESCGASLFVACPRCGVDVAAGARFCRRCGGALSSGVGEYTPRHLTETVLTSRGALDGERKQVTVLFCGLAGSTGLAESVGAERMHALLERFFGLALAEIQRYEGTINQFLGDGLMALFGAPIAREDHARRAVLAALGIQRALRELDVEGEAGRRPVAARIGINTGPVVVGTIGDSLRMDYTAVGDTTNVAWRLEQAAGSGEILVGESTARLAQGYVRLEAMPMLPVKGKATPLAVRRVVGPGPRRSRLDEAGGRALTDFVGREDELAHLAALLARAEAGRGQVIGVVGEPGVGKSRLLREFRRRLGGRPVTWLEGHCVPYGHAIPYLPVLEIIRENCALAEDDRPEVMAAKVRAGLREVGLDADAGAPYLLQLLGLKEGAATLGARSPEAVKARTFELLRQMTLGGSRRRPLVIVVEDLHWVDTISEEYAASLVERVPTAPILLIFTYRPGYRPRWGDRSSGTQLALTQLGPAESRRVVLGTLTGAPLPADVTERILEKAEGNPLFLEELVRVATEPGRRGSPAAVPDTVQDVLSARVDRLPEAARRLLQCAAVLGRQFSVRLLRAVWDEPPALDEPLRELGRLEFLEERFGAGEPTFLFKHALVQEVIYDTILERHRRVAHHRAGRALEDFYAGRLDEVVELLAHHFTRSDDAQRAVEYALLAAEKAQRRGAHLEALAHLDTALERLAALPDSPARRRRHDDVLALQSEITTALMGAPA
jgi:class 3 adenylate cyclase